MNSPWSDKFNDHKPYEFHIFDNILLSLLLDSIIGSEIVNQYHPMDTWSILMTRSNLMKPGRNWLFLASSIQYWSCYSVVICNTVWCCYNTVNFLANIHKWHLIAHPTGWGMGCLLWVQPLINILPEFLYLYMQYLTILDHVIMALDCICGKASNFNGLSTVWGQQLLICK